LVVVALSDVFDAVVLDGRADPGEIGIEDGERPAARGSSPETPARPE
jgi:hypothetical protein